MNTYTTQLKAIDPIDGKLKTWFGQNIKAISFEDAEMKIKEFGYLSIHGKLITEIDENTNTKINFENLN